MHQKHENVLQYKESKLTSKAFFQTNFFKKRFYLGSIWNGFAVKAISNISKFAEMVKALYNISLVNDPKSSVILCHTSI